MVFSQASLVRRCLAAGLACLLASVPLQAKRDEAPSAAQALSYGVMLYEYFQQHHFGALREYAVAEQRNDLQGHGTHPRLMHGGISLAFGMDRNAERIFNELLDGSYSKGVESQAWFYLGKIAYQRSNFERARDVLEEINPYLPKRFQDEYRSLVSQLSLRYENFQHAEAALERITDESAYKAYTNFNIGAAYQKRFIRSQGKQEKSSDWYPASLRLDAAASQALQFDRSGLETTLDDEFQALADRALLASGYALLQGERHDAAIDRFKRVRLSGPYASQAMLGYGWAEVEQGNFEAALTPWEHLIGQPLINAAVQEAYVGIPFLYEKLGASAKALQGFEQAAVAYRQEMHGIEKAVRRLQGSNIMDLFVVEQPEGFVDWVAATDDIVINPQTPYLAELLAGHSFQSSLTDLRDLYALKANLEDWQRRLASFQFSLDSRRRILAEIRDGDKKELLTLADELDARRKALNARLSDIERSHDAIALLPTNEARLAHRAADAVATARLLQGQGADLGDKLAWSELLAGVALWDAHQKSADNNWQLRKNLQIIDETLAAADSRAESIEDILSQQRELKSFDQRIAAATEQLGQALQDNRQGIARAQQQLADMAIVQLTRHYRNIQSYLSQTQLAITRLYDIQASSLDEAMRSGEPQP